MAAGGGGGLFGRAAQIPWREIAHDAFDRIFLVAKAAAAVHLVNAHLCGIAFVWGPSMVPTLNTTGDVVAVERMTPSRRNVSLGDVVLFRSPSDPNRTVTKRVLGLEGDAVTYKAADAATTTIVVPKGHVWVQGDNVYNSKDSRQFGPIPIGLIQGRAFLRVWPPEAIGFIGQKLPLD